MARDLHSQPNTATLMDTSYEFNNPFVVKRFTDLLALGGIWVAMILIGQVVMTWYVARPLGQFLVVPVLQVAATLGVAYLALDVVVYLVLRGRMIFQWMVPALCVAASVVVPGLVIYLVQAVHRL